MKKFLIALICLIPSLCFAGTHKYEGQWQIDNIVYTFDKDTLYVDELGNEGDVYIIVKITDKQIIGKNDFNDIEINVVKWTTDKMVINIDGIHNFILKKNKKRVKLT